MTNDQSLRGRGVLVTGGSSGIGRAIALAAARAGADVLVTYRANREGARQVEREVASLGRRAATMQLDLADDRSVSTLGTRAKDAFGRIDAWVNNAGADILTGDTASLSTIEKLDVLLAVDLRGTILASWQAAALLAAQEDGGVIINMSWDHALAGMAGINPQLFSAVKGGVLAFSKSLARSVAPRVRVNVLAPGWIRNVVWCRAGGRSAARHCRVHAAQALGNAGRCSGCGGVSGVAGRRVSDRSDDRRQWRRRHVNVVICSSVHPVI